ncbi:hypothetical protein LLEC1_06309 [Akanthomyces lecanii]|uniref:BTB domain-containing protein n=1 Tax=Cordyceps confragosa TaxID=2714763 RepID=A0A179IGP5_CORDF|nr:hypothetical protein LLEC1_06309 [Akanthomyces lecanii]
MRNGEFSDLTFLCKQQNFYVHKAVVCAQSVILRDEIRDAPLDNSSIKTIDMSEYLPEIVNGFVRYFYTGDYASGKAQETVDSKPEDDVLAEILSHIQFHHIASRYKVGRMATLSASNLKSLLQKYEDETGLVSALPSAARMAHSLASDHDVKDAVAASFTQHLDKLLNDGKFSEFHNMPDFLELVLRHCARRIVARKEFVTRVNKKLQVVKEEGLQRSAALEETIQLIRDRKRCINSSCRSVFNAEVSETFEITCRLCCQKQKLTAAAPGETATAVATPTGANAPTPLAPTQMYTFGQSPAPNVAKAPAATPEAKSAPGPVTSSFAAPVSSPLLGRKTGGGRGRGRGPGIGRGRGNGWGEGPDLNYN